MAMKKSLFTIDGSPCFVGYTSEQYWNGWSCPCFTKEVCKNICDEIRNNVECDAYYDKATDSFIIKNTYSVSVNNPEGILEIVKGFDAETPDGKLHLYPLGRRYWIWSDIPYKTIIQTTDGNLWNYIGYEDGFHKVFVIDKDDEDLIDTNRTQYLTDDELVGAEIY